MRKKNRGFALHWDNLVSGRVRIEQRAKIHAQSSIAKIKLPSPVHRSGLTEMNMKTVNENFNLLIIGAVRTYF